MHPTEIPTVAEFMTRNPATVDSELPLQDALDRMSLNGIRHLIVTAGNQMIGVVSSRDVTFATSFPGVKPGQAPVSSATYGTPYTCEPTTPIDRVVAVMEEKRYGSAIVVDNDTVVGVFTTVDALRAVRELATGKPAARLRPPTHDVDHSKDEGGQRTGSVAANSLRSHHAAPSPNDGKIG